MANTITFTPESIQEYVNVHKDELLTKASLGAKSLEYAELMLNVKYKDTLNYLDSTVVLADGSDCDWNPQGSDTISQRTIEVAPITVQKEFCWKDFRKTFANYQLNFEAGRETLPFEEKIAASNMAAIKDEVEKMVWIGNDFVTGWVADAKESTNDAVEFAEGATATAKVDAMVAALTARMLKKGVNIFMSYTDFRNYVLEQNASCCANRGILDAASESIKYVGDSRITLVPVAGLEGTEVMFAATPDALVFATDIEGAENVYKFWYDEKEDKMLFKVLFNAGSAIKYLDEVIVGE